MTGKDKISRKIHWCWLSDEPIPSFLHQCMSTWRKHLPDYEIKCWTQENFDIHSVPFVAEAIKTRKWAFAADYIRLYAIYTEGGIYLDSDVELFRSLDDFLKYDFFTGTDYHSVSYKDSTPGVDTQGHPVDPQQYVRGHGLQAAIIGACKGDSFVRECLDYYEFRHFAGAEHEIISPFVFAKLAEKHGFVYLDKDQTFDDRDGVRRVFDSGMFPNIRIQIRWRTAAFHHCAGSWRIRPLYKHRIIGDRLPLLQLKYWSKHMFHTCFDPFKRLKTRHYKHA